LLTDGVISLIPPAMKDAGDLYQATRESLTEMSPWLPFAHSNYSIKESRDFLKRCPKGWRKNREFNFKIVDPRDGSFIGMCGLNNIEMENHRANLGYWVRTSRCQQGVATAATILLAKWGFQTLRLRRIEILVATGNQRSLRVAEKVGAYREGILRNRLWMNDRMHDAVMYSLVPGDV
jgi:RimJ/RimL family protein N-acetyltransferase